ncbi:MAG: hypothetical protein KatS3mg110_2943 [Pirellulaceae bacterium]|nr:MAG: hypothetical protein KatS3mg110_2943 [Pirellulaceae bacterium]
MACVLLVEDSAVQQALLGRLLSDLPADVLYATTAAEARRFLANEAVDMAVVDLVLPDADGLDLLREIHETWPQVGIIAVTAQGDEQTVVEALRAGAAYYVPKAEVSTLLLPTACSLMARVACEQNYGRLIQCAERVCLEFRLDNDPALIEPLVDLLQQLIANLGRIDANERVRFGVAVEQALLNALLRGNLEIPGPAAVAAGAKPVGLAERLQQKPYSDRRIDVFAELTRSHASVQIKDEGPGFDVAAFEYGDLWRRVSGPEGRGLVLMKAFADEVRFHPRGNQVTLIKRLQAQAQPEIPHTLQAPVSAAQEAILAELQPLDQGPVFRVRQPRVVIGRDRSCDLVLPFPDVSAHHCQMFIFGGWWYVKDLHTKNGIRVNGVPVARKRLIPGDVLHISRHRYQIHYDPAALGAVGITPPPEPF